MSDPPGAVGHKGSLAGCRGITAPAGSDAVTGFPFGVAGSFTRRGRNERPAQLPERYRMGIEREKLESEVGEGYRFRPHPTLPLKGEGFSPSSIDQPRSNPLSLQGEV